ncbi:MAG: hypothetical protein V3V01_03620 [Acidimicrobiales bacterium]
MGNSAPLTRRFPAPEPIDIAWTTRALNEAAKRTPEGVWWATNTPDGAASALIARQEDDIIVQAWGVGSEWILEQTPLMLGIEDDPASLPLVGDAVTKIARHHPGLRIGRSGRVMEALLNAVLGQKIQATMAHKSARSLRWKFGQPSPGPCPIQLLPTSEQIAKMSYTDLHPLGVERKRANIIINCAKRAHRVEETTQMSLVDAETRLLAFDGIGPWTAALTMQAALGDADAVAVGDYHLPNTVSWALAGEPRADDARMLDLLEPYRGHRGRVTKLLKYSGTKAPKYGPRLELWSPAKL